MSNESTSDLTLSLAGTTSAGAGDATVATTPLSQFGEYELLREIARGGMGIVYEARHRGLNRRVALKMILSGSLASEMEIKRFFVEAQAAARLNHPGIVSIHEIGQHEGQHFFTMTLIEGASLIDRLRDGPLPPREAASLVREIAQAVEYAHSNGVLHRDLKPQNILIDRVTGQPKVTDFGLAKQLGTGDGLTATGEVLGTPSYMSPEQAVGKVSELGPQVDVYALGAILYALLAGRPPFQTASVMETLKQVVETDPAPLRLLNRQVDRDLETICMKCLEKDPQRRYATAQALADDLARYLDGNSINARSFNALERVARSLERSQIDEGYESWSTILFWWSGIVLVSQVGFFVVIAWKFPRIVIYGMLALQLIAMALPVWAFRAWHSLTANVAQRQLWSIGTGFLITCMIAGPIQQNLMGVDKMYEFHFMPIITVLSGFCLYVLGSNYWGWLYGVSFLFFLWAYVSSLYPPMSPLGFGLLWSFSLALIAARLKRSALRSLGSKSALRR